MQPYLKWPISLKTRNMGSEKSYAHVYAVFKKKMRFDKKTLDEVYNTKYMKHFYSKQEILDSYKKWEKKPL